MKILFNNILFKVLPIILIFVVSGVTLFFAYGYQFDVSERVFQKTSIIDIIKPFAVADVYLDGIIVKDQLPVQMKSILPGKHKILVKKDKFLSWSRTINVREDYVSIIKDVLLVPTNIKDYVKELLVFEGENIVYGNDYLLVYLEDSNVLKVIFFGRNGAIVEEEMQFFHNDFDVIDNYSNGRFLLLLNDIRFLNDQYVYVDFENEEFQLFMLPKGARKVRIDVGNENVFYLDDNSLFKVSFDILQENKFEDNNIESCVDDVDDFDIDVFGNAFFVSDGKLQKIDVNRNVIPQLVESDIDNLVNVSLYDAKTYWMLITMDSNNVRRLYYLNNDSELVYVTEQLRGRSYMNAHQQILYANTQGHIFIYNILDDKREFLEQIEGDFAIGGWFDDDGHYILLSGGSVAIRNIFDSVSLKLLDNDVDFVFAKEKALFYVFEKSLKRIYWQTAL